MTVKELKSLLEDMPEDGIVSIGNTDDGFSEAMSVTVHDRWLLRQVWGGYRVFHQQHEGARKDGHNVLIAGGVFS